MFKLEKANIRRKSECSNLRKRIFAEKANVQTESEYTTESEYSLRDGCPSFWPRGGPFLGHHPLPYMKLLPTYEPLVRL
jgi:hypothetical protein